MTAWKKTFISAFMAQILSVVGFSFAMPFLPFFISDLGVAEDDRVLWAGIILAAAALAMTIFSPIWGTLADRFGRKVMVMRAMFSGTIVLLLMSTAQTVHQLFVYRLLQGALTGTLAASVALVASVTPNRRSGFALGMMQSALYLGVCIGPLFGGIVADHFGYRNAFRVGAAIVFLGGVLIWLGAEEDFRPPDRTNRENHVSFKGVLTTGGFLAAVLVMTVVRFGNATSLPAFPLIVEEVRHTKEALNTVTGLIVSSSGLAGAGAAALFGWLGDRRGHRKILLFCTFVGAVASLAHVRAETVEQLFVARLAFGVAVAGMLPAANAVVKRVIPDHGMGKAFGLATSISLIGMVLGPLVSGYMGSKIGLRSPFFVCAGAQLLTAMIVILGIRNDMTENRQED